MSDCIDLNCSVSAPSASSGFCSECWSPPFSGVSSSEIMPLRASSSLDLNTSSLYAGFSAASDRAPIDSRKSAGDLVREGTFVQSAQSPRIDQNQRLEGEQPKVIVSEDASVTPDYIVRRDGKIEVVGNPDAGDKAPTLTRVQVEPGADRQKTDDLLRYINERMRVKDASAELSLSAAPGLVSEDVSRLFKSAQDSSPDGNTPAENENYAADDGSPCNPGGGGGCPGPSPSPEEYPPDSQLQDSPDNPLPDADFKPQLPAGPMDGILEASRINNWENNSMGSLGAYEINAPGWFSSWLDDEMLAELGNPPDFRKLGKVLAKYKNNPKFKNAMAARLSNMREQGDNKGAEKIESLFSRLGDEKEEAFAQDFGIFLNSQLPGGRNATGEEMNRFFDRDMQMAVASSRIADVARDARLNLKDMAAEQAAKMALAGALGHIPGEKEISEYEQYLELVRSRYQSRKTPPL